MTNLIYLSGPITGLTYDDGNDWRVKVTAKLEGHTFRGPVYGPNNEMQKIRTTNIKCLNPMRAHHFLREQGIIGDRDGQDRADGFLVSDEFIGQRDAWDTMRATALLVNLLGAKRVSIGTVLEIGMAHAVRVPVFLVAEDAGNVHEHGMIRAYTTMRFNNLDDACTSLLAMYGE
jgi:nucleoside 2-deoxyribosyltransferase